MEAPQPGGFSTCTVSEHMYTSFNGASSHPWLRRYWAGQLDGHAAVNVLS